MCCNFNSRLQNTANHFKQTQLWEQVGEFKHETGFGGCALLKALWHLELHQCSEFINAMGETQQGSKADEYEIVCVKIFPNTGDKKCLFLSGMANVLPSANDLVGA